jgi:hypothetical protein
MDRSVNQDVNALLLQQDYARLLSLCKMDRRFWKALQSKMYDTDENVRWPAIEAVARLLQEWWQDGHEERVREFVRRLIWSVTDESGGIGWSAPQTIARIIVLIPSLVDPYGSIMISRALVEPVLVESGLWCIGCLAGLAKGAVDSFQDMVLDVFNSDDPQTLGVAAWAMGEVSFAPALPFLKLLKDRMESVRIYIGGHFQEKTLGRWAEDAISRISHA